MKTTVRLLCMLCNASLSEADDDSTVAAARVDERGRNEGWKRINDADVCAACGDAAWKAFMPRDVPDAVQYALVRVRDDVDFFYVMHYTETLRRLCQAHALIVGKPLAEIEEIARTPRFPKTAKAREEALRERIRELES